MEGHCNTGCHQPMRYHARQARRRRDNPLFPQGQFQRIRVRFENSWQRYGSELDSRQVYALDGSSPCSLLGFRNSDSRRSRGNDMAHFGKVILKVTVVVVGCCCCCFLCCCHPSFRVKSGSPVCPQREIEHSARFRLATGLDGAAAVMARAWIGWPAAIR